MQEFVEVIKAGRPQLTKSLRWDSTRLNCLEIFIPKSGHVRSASVCWEIKTFPLPHHSNACGRTLQTVGTILHRRNIATFHLPTQVDIDNHKLFHQVGRGHPAINSTDSMVIKFMEDNILSWFGYPIKIITRNDQVFKYVKFIIFYQKFNIIIRDFATYYPQGNNLAESSNQTMVRVLKKTITKNQKN